MTAKSANLIKPNQVLRINNSKAPVLVIVYNRYNHFVQTIEALKNNYLASETILYIASDYPNNNDDNEAVFKIREYIQTITGFKNVVPLLREQNVGAVNNSKLAREVIFSKYDKMIMMEDDVVTGRGFLNFINEGLVKYEKNDNVMAICGYFFPINNIGHNENQVFLKLFNAWGYGTWRDKIQKIPRDSELSREFLKSFTLFWKMNCLSPHLLPMVSAIAESRLEAFDVNMCLYLIKKNSFCVFPSQSLTRNTGFDGSGLHCGNDNYFSKQPYFNGLLEISEGVAIKDTKGYNRAVFQYFGGCKKLFVNMFSYYLKKYRS